MVRGHGGGAEMWKAAKTEGKNGRQRPEERKREVERTD